MRAKFKRLNDVTRAKIIALFNHPQIKRHMPLIKGRFTTSDCDKFLSEKEQMWKEYGYGPWAFLVDGQFAGWGGCSRKRESRTWPLSCTRIIGDMASSFLMKLSIVHFIYWDLRPSLPFCRHREKTKKR